MFQRKNAKRLIKNGRRLYGGIFGLPSGKEIYVAFRKQAEMFRGGEKSLADAIQKGKASWAIDYDTLIRLRTEGVYFVAIQTKETGDLYVATLGDFYAAPVLNYESRGGALQRYLPLDRFIIQLGSVKGVARPKRRSAAAAVI
jgi:hypothetical protein